MQVRLALDALHAMGHLRGFLELHGDVHQADLLGAAFAESREILPCQ